MEFKLYRLNEVANFLNGRAYLMPELQNEGKYRIVRVGNFSGKDEWYYSDMELGEDKYCQAGDLLYKWACNFGPEIWEGEKVIYHYHIWKVIPKIDLVNKMFLFYYLKYQTPFWLGGTNGTTMVHITKENMERKKILIPLSTIVQEKIASILSAYDELIENNLNRVKKLEALAENLYKEWFVRFRFPGYQTTEFENGIPKDWDKNRIECLGIFKRGRNITSDEMVNGDIPVISAGLEPSGYHNQANVKGPSVTISSSGANAGYLQLNYSDIWAADCSYMNETECIYFVYALLNSIRVQITNLQRGSAQPHVYASDVNKIKIVIPNKELRLLYNNQVKNIHQEIYNLQKQNANLIKQRDLLLPRLMSGKLEVS